jgi:hypothetical protein
MNRTVGGWIQLGRNASQAEAAKAAGRSNRKTKAMKLKIKFGEQAGFEKPIRGTVPPPVKWVPNFLALLRATARAERQRPSTRRAD